MELRKTKWPPIKRLGAKENKDKTVLVKVRCSGRQHRILYKAGSLTLLDHTKDELRKREILGKLTKLNSCRCLEIRERWILAMRWGIHKGRGGRLKLLTPYPNPQKIHKIQDLKIPRGLTELAVYQRDRYFSHPASSGRIRHSYTIHEYGNEWPKRVRLFVSHIVKSLVGEHRTNIGSSIYLSSYKNADGFKEALHKTTVGIYVSSFSFPAYYQSAFFYDLLMLYNLKNVRNEHGERACFLPPRCDSIIRMVSRYDELWQEWNKRMKESRLLTNTRDVIESFLPLPVVEILVNERKTRISLIRKIADSAYIIEHDGETGS